MRIFFHICIMNKKVTIVSAIMLLALAGCGANSDNTPKADTKADVIASAEESTESTEYVVKTEESKFGWVGRKVVGEHYGTVDIKSGNVFVKDGEIEAGSVTMDMTTIVCEDSKAVEGHLKKSDFFEIDKYSEASFEVSSIEKKDKADEEGRTHMVTGNLTIKGITKTISFPAMIEITGEKVMAKAKFDIDRTLWGIQFRSGQFFENLGDSMIDDNFTVEFDVIAERA